MLGHRFEKGLFLRTPGCPVLRPLPVHWPNWVRAPWGNGRMPGFLEGVETCSHFAQPSSLEFQCGIEWRTLMLRHTQAKRSLNAEHATQLATVMQIFSQVKLTCTDWQAACPCRLLDEGFGDDAIASCMGCASIGVPVESWEHGDDTSRIGWCMQGQFMHHVCMHLRIVRAGTLYT